jgi:hypothetical protein
MKQVRWVLCWLLVVCFSLLNVQAKADDLADLAEKIALDLTKLSELKGILSDMKTGYDVLTKGYNTIKDISEGNFNLHDAFLSGLLKVSPLVTKYYKVGEIIQMESTMLSEYTAGLKRCRGSGVFSAGELTYLQNVFDNVFGGTLDRLDQLLMVITSGKLRMSDEERLKSIDAIHADVNNRLTFVRSFNEDNATLTLQRVKEMMNLELLRAQMALPAQ